MNVDKKLVDRAKVQIYASQMMIFISATTCEYQTCNIVIIKKIRKISNLIGVRNQGFFALMLPWEIMHDFSTTEE